MTPKLRWFLPLAALSLALDQASKVATLRGLGYGESHVVIPGFFSLTHLLNPGGVWSFLASAPETVRIPLFIGGAAVAVAIVVHFVWRLEPDARLAGAALGTILGGVLGNLLDRILHGGVVDMLDFTLPGGYVWPTFNLADSFIVLGVGLLVVELLVAPRVETAS